MYVRNPYYRRHSDYFRNYYDDYCDYDRHCNLYRRRAKRDDRKYLYDDMPYYNLQ